MPIGDEFVGVDEAAQLLGVSTRRLRQMRDDGEVAFGARGLVERASIDRHLVTHQGARKAWSPWNAWAATALLGGVDASWASPSSQWRIRKTLAAADAQQLVSRTRDRARVHRYRGHRSAAAHLREDSHVLEHGQELDLAEDVTRFDGYIPAAYLDRLVHRHALVEDARGNITLRATEFDLETVKQIVHTGGAVLAALDLAESLDPRERGVALEALTNLLAQVR